MDSQARKDDPFLAGVEISSALGSQGKGCAGALIYKGHAVAPPPPVKKEPMAMDEAGRILADMNAQFGKWRGAKKDRGAYWGASGPGVTKGAKSVPITTINTLKARCGGSGWEFKDSRSSGLSFHRSGKGECDFIYHMKPPVG